MFADADQHTATIDAEGRIVLPSTLLEKQGWKPGMRVLLEETDDGVLVTTGEEWA